MSERPVRLAIYDLDRTITTAPTWTPFLLHAARERAPWRLALLPVMAGGMLAHVAGLVGRRALKPWMQRLILGRITTADAERVATSFAAAVRIAPGAAARIAADRAAGYRIVIATAANRFYAAAIANRLGVGDLIATDVEAGADGALGSRLSGENCYGPAKLAMIERWLREQGIDRRDSNVRFYSDHVSDAPTMAWADEPFAVNPHRRLRRLAQERGWPILDWRGAP